MTKQLLWVIGDKATKNRDSNGYLVVSFKGKQYKYHRLAFLWMTGSFPKNFVDHKDGDVSNNKWENLREATNSENQFNRAGNRKKTVAGYKGVTPSGSKFKAIITIKGKHIYLGSFETAEEAGLIYDQKAKELHGDFYHGGK
jgi:hypothetical protein